MATTEIASDGLGFLPEIKDETIERIERVGGGLGRCKELRLFLTNGKILVVETSVDISKYGIYPTMDCKVGKWAEMKPINATQGEGKGTHETT